MILSVAFVGLCVMIEAWPVYLIAARALKPDAAQPGLWALAPSVALVAALTAAAVIVPLRLGVKRLDAIEK